jgi:cell division septation protein DedD
MKNKDYRELQLTSSQLIIIFIGILILGVIIFLLGVSVGKKQAQLFKKNELSAKTILEEVKETKPTIPVKETTPSIKKELETHEKVKKESRKKPPALESKKEFYYIQVAAYKNRDSAYSTAATIEKLGFPAIVVKPSGKNSLFRVRVGGYSSRDQAEQTKDKLAKVQGKKSSDYFIIYE